MYFESWDASQKQWVQMNTTQAAYFFNQARCLCSEDQNAEFKVVIEAGTGVDQQITNLLSTTSAVPGGQGVGYLFVGKQGTDCLVANTVYVGSNLAAYCTNLEAPDSGYPGNGFTLLEIANTGHYESAAIPVARLYGAYVGCNSSQSCDTPINCNFSSPVDIQFWAQTQAGSFPDFDGQVSGAAINMVANVLATPTNVTVQAGNESLVVNWSWPSTESISTDTILNGVQIFCRRGASYQVYADGTFGAAYLTPTMVCPNTAPTPPATADPLTLEEPLYLCSGLIPPATQSYRMTGLQDGISYGVAIAAVDKYGNIGTLSGIAYGMPIAGTAGAGGTLGAGGSGGSAGGLDAESTGGTLGSGGATGDSPPDGAASLADAGTGVRLANGCSCDIRGKHDRSETAGISWLAVVTLAFALRSLRFPNQPISVSRSSRRLLAYRLPVWRRLRTLWISSP